MILNKMSPLPLIIVCTQAILIQAIVQDCGGYQTVGIDMVVTGERIILLNTQVSSNVSMYSIRSL